MNKLIAIFAILAALTTTLQARAEDKDYCQKTRERAIADKVLALSPALELEALKYPVPNTLTSVIGGSISNAGFQFRGAVSYDFLNAYRGTMLMPLAESDCKQHSMQTEAQNLLEQAADIGRANALRKLITYLENQNIEWQSVLDQAELRVRAGTMVLSELQILRTTAAALDMKLANARGQLQLLEAHDYVKQARPVSELVSIVQSASMDFENQTSKVRMLDPWELNMSVGAIPPIKQGDQAEWYGALTVGYKFGGLVRAERENNYLAARMSELRHARYELTDMLRRMTDGVHANKAAAEKQIDVLAERWKQLSATRFELESHPDAKNAANLQALVSLQIIDVESDWAYLGELRRQLTMWR